MQWVGIIAALMLAFYGGTRFTAPVAPPDEKPNEVCADYTEYLQLKEHKAKYDMANAVLAKIMKIFIADLGLQASNKQLCKINSEITSALVAAARPSGPGPSLAVEALEAQTPAPLPAAKPGSIVGRQVVSNRRGEGRAAGGTTTNTRGRRLVFSPETAKGAVHALYQAVLWRVPDAKGEAEAVRKFSEEGWNTYLRNARGMVQSSEFLRDVEPNHNPEEIIKHMFAVYLGRCPSANELRRQLDSLTRMGRQGPAEVISSIINISRRNHADQILVGGYNSNSCSQ